jgi:hypothetical protein
LRVYPKILHSWEYLNAITLLLQLSGVSKQCVSDVEYGKPTVQRGLVLKLLVENGAIMPVNIPEESKKSGRSCWIKARTPSQPSRSKSFLSASN